LIYANFPSSQTGSYAMVEPAENVVQSDIYGEAFAHTPVAPPAMSRISRAVEAPHLNWNISEGLNVKSGSFVVSHWGNENGTTAMIPVPVAVELVAYRTADHVSAWAPSVVKTALFLTWYGAYEYVATLDVLKIISFEYSMTNFAVFDGWTVHAA